MGKNGGKLGAKKAKNGQKPLKISKKTREKKPSKNRQKLLKIRQKRPKNGQKW